MKSNAIYFLSKHVSQIRDFDLPDPGPFEVQVRCIANGICMGEVSLFNDIETDRWPLPMMVGHEGVGVVTKVGRDVTSLHEGDWVTCVKWARDMNYPAQDCRRLSAPPEDPTTFLAEPVECACRCVRYCDLVPGDRIALIGCGFMGLINLQLLARSPIERLVAIDLKDSNLALARSFGATETINPSTRAGQSRLDALRAGRVFDVTIDCAGAQQSLDDASSLLRAGGRLMIFAWHHRPRPVPLSDWQVLGFRVLNPGPAISMDESIDYRERAVRLLEHRVVDLTQLISHRHPASQVQQAMELASLRPDGYVKGVLDFRDF